jgi:hypothetical protein
MLEAESGCHLDVPPTNRPRDEGSTAHGAEAQRARLWSWQSRWRNRRMWDRRSRRGNAVRHRAMLTDRRESARVGWDRTATRAARGGRRLGCGRAHLATRHGADLGVGRPGVGTTAPTGRCSGTVPRRAGPEIPCYWPGLRLHRPCHAAGCDGRRREVVGAGLGATRALSPCPPDQSPSCQPSVVGRSA